MQNFPTLNNVVLTTILNANQAAVEHENLSNYLCSQVRLNDLAELERIAGQLPARELINYVQGRTAIIASLTDDEANHLSDFVDLANDWLTMF